MLIIVFILYVDNFKYYKNNDITMLNNEIPVFRNQKKRRAFRRRKATKLGFKFHTKPVRKHGIRISWQRNDINSRTATCLVCSKNSKDCICKIEVSNNQIHF